MGQQYIVKQRRYWYSEFRGLVADISVVDEPADFGESVYSLERRRRINAGNGWAADIWIEPIRDSAYVIEERWYNGWKAFEYYEAYREAEDAFERFAHEPYQYRLSYADGSPIEDSTADDAYEAYRDHVRTESNILAKRSRAW
jgi:hypothetical protein